MRDWRNEALQWSMWISSRQNEPTMLESGLGRTTRAMLTVYPMARGFLATAFGVVAAVFYRGSRQDVYNILWAVVFGFATLNILGLAARRMEPSKRGMSFGEF